MRSDMIRVDLSVRLMEKDFKDIHVIKDLAGLDRVVYGTLKA